MNRHVTAKPILIMLSMVLLFLSGCSEQIDTTALAAIPTVNTDSLDKVVQVQINDVLEKLNDKPLNAKRNGYTAMNLQVYRFLPEADVLYSRAQLIDPKEVRWFYYRALVKQKMGDLEAALFEFERAVELSPNNSIIQIGLADTLLELGRNQEASTHYQKLLEKYSDKAEIWHGYGRLLRQDGKYQASIDAYQKVIDLEGHFGPAYLGMVQNFRQLGQMDKAEEYLALQERHKDKRIAVNDKLGRDLRKLDRSVTTRSRMARQLVAADRIEDAIDVLNKISRDEPEHVGTHVSLIGLYTSQDNHEKVEHHIAEALRIGADRPKLFFNIGTYHLKNGDYAAAVEAYLRASELSPEDADVLVRLGMSYERLDDDGNAQKHFLEALSKDVNHREANFLLGRQYAELKQYEKALPLLEIAAMTKDKKQATYLNILARMQAISGDLASALLTIQEAKTAINDSTEPDLVKRIDSDFAKIRESLDQ